MLKDADSPIQEKVIAIQVLHRLDHRQQEAGDA
jgi:hypothetical protein